MSPRSVHDSGATRLALHVSRQSRSCDASSLSTTSQSNEHLFRSSRPKRDVRLPDLAGLSAFLNSSSANGRSGFGLLLIWFRLSFRRSNYYPASDTANEWSNPQKEAKYLSAAPGRSPHSHPSCAIRVYVRRNASGRVGKRLPGSMACCWSHMVKTAGR
jgi:hypothetical protein